MSRCSSGRYIHALDLPKKERMKDEPCARMLILAKFINKKGNTDSAPVCPDCDGLSRWPKGKEFV